MHEVKREYFVVDLRLNRFFLVLGANLKFKSVVFQWAITCFWDNLPDFRAVFQWIDKSP